MKYKEIYITIIILIISIMVIHMIHKATAMNVRKNLGELLNEVQYQNHTILITKSGKSVAAIVDIELFERIRNLRKLFDELTLELNSAYKDIDSSIAEAEINEAIDSKNKY